MNKLGTLTTRCFFTPNNPQHTTPATKAKLVSLICAVLEMFKLSGVGVGTSAKGEVKQNEITGELANYGRFHQR